MLRALIAFGAQESDLAEIRKQAESNEGAFAVWPENWQAVEVFCYMASQWRLITGASSAHWQGLRYEALESVLRLLLIPRRRWAELFAQVRIMEFAARDSLNARRAA